MGVGFETVRASGEAGRMMSLFSIPPYYVRHTAAGTAYPIPSLPGATALSLPSHVPHLHRVSPARCPSHRPPFGLDAHGPRCAAGSPAPAARVLAQVHRAGPRRRARVCGPRRTLEQGRDGRRHARRAGPRGLGVWWARPERGAFSFSFSSPSPRLRKRRLPPARLLPGCLADTKNQTNSTSSPWPRRPTRSRSRPCQKYSASACRPQTNV